MLTASVEGANDGLKTANLREKVTWKYRQMHQYSVKLKNKVNVLMKCDLRMKDIVCKWLWRRLVVCLLMQLSDSVCGVLYVGMLNVALLIFHFLKSRGFVVFIRIGFSKAGLFGFVCKWLEIISKLMNRRATSHCQKHVLILHLV